MDGLLLINKPAGWTSFDVVHKVRNRLRAKKVGHTGTLDPQATGLLILCLGKATKMVEKMTAWDKEYVGQITLGGRSRTDDAEGPVEPVPNAQPASREAAEEALKAFTGTFEQMPPDFSAKKVGGKKAYEAARQGKPLELKAVKVTIRELELLNYTWPILKIRVLCSKGTYIRSLARDVGKKLGVGGYLSALVRTKVGHYTLEQACEIEQVTPQKILIDKNIR